MKTFPWNKNSEGGNKVITVLKFKDVPFLCKLLNF